MKAYKDPNGNIQLFRPLDNFSRLNASATRLCMPTIEEELFMNGLKALLKLDSDWVPQSDAKSLYIRPFMIGDSTFYQSDTFKALSIHDYYLANIHLLQW